MCTASDFHIQVLEKGMIDCADVETLLGDLVDGDLLPSLQSRLEDHINNCEQCAESAHGYRWVIAQAKELKSPPLPKDVATRLRENLNKKLGLSLAV